MAVFKRRWFMWDLARQRRFDRKEFLMVAQKLSGLGYNGIGLYLEGAFELNCIGGGILRKGIMTREDALWIKEKCKELGLFVFPMTNVVGHMEHFMRQERFKHLCADLKQGCLDIKFDIPEAEEFALKIVYEYLDAFDTDYIHIGGDEAALTDENRPIYAKFLSGLCDKLLADGIKTAIWNDLLWEHKELVAGFNRDIEIYDWHYFGHRPESIEFFIKEGFKKLIVCPCENSWIGFINHQNIPEWQDPKKVEGVLPDEVEAFFEDAIEKADPENLQGMLTLWESTMGRDLWGQWSAIARAVLFMKGEYEAKTRDDKTLEMAVFGRITPYTEISHIIQDEIHSVFTHSYKSMSARMAVFTKQKFFDTAAEAFKTGKELAPIVAEPISRIDALLEGWTPENEFEKYCKSDLVSVSALMKAAFALNSAFASCGRLYTEAAKIQFESPEKARALVMEFADGFTAAAERNREYRAVLKNFIDITTHTETDLIRLDATYKYMQDTAEALRNLATAPSFEEIPLPTINYVLSWVLDQEIIEK